MHVLTFMLLCVIIHYSSNIWKGCVFMKCKKCGAEISDDAEFCPVCRSSVSGTEQETVSYAAPPAPKPAAAEELPPVEPADYYAGAAEPVEIPARKPRRMNLAVSIVLAVVFGILSMSVCQTAALLCTISGALSSHAVSEQIADLDVGSIQIGSFIPDDIKSQFGIVSAEITNGIVPAKITDDIAGIVSEISDGALSREQAAEIIQKADISKDLAKIVKSYEDYITSGKSDIDISAELQRAIISAKQVYKDVTGNEAPADFDSEVINTLRDNAEALQQAAPQAALGVMGDTLHVVFSPLAWIAAFVISAVFPVLTGLITRRVPAALMCGGAAYLISGVGILISSAMNDLLLSNIVSMIGLDDLIAELVSNALNGRMMVCGAVLAAVGAALTAAFIAVKVTTTRKLKKA